MAWRTPGRGPSMLQMVPRILDFIIIIQFARIVCFLRGAFVGCLICSMHYFINSFY